MRIRLHRPGFTLLELLIVLAVLGLFATLAVLSLNGARRAQRDAQRLSDISVLRSALGNYWLEKATYPTSDGVELGRPGANTDVFNQDGFVGRDSAKPPFYLERVPVGPSANEYYRYRGSSNGYSIRFVTESETAIGKANVYYLHSTGIDQADEEK